ncbi:hypothetical protein [Paenarthrobacter sp. FR1]|uniref:hypothetical protein n=1 Tax=Paenarthrobacter sp. FR1 TaxID=3439548 RepID=UPI003DA49C92
MDQETIRLIITATAALLAGWGGSGLTAYINRRNTTDTLAASERSRNEQWDRTESREHEVWVRDQKQQAYADFVLEADKAVSDARSMWKGGLDESSVNISGARMRIRMVGSPVLRTVAWEVEQALKKLLEYSRPEVDQYGIPRQRSGSYEEHSFLALEVEALLQDFVAKSRRDLGTASPGDSSVRDGVGIQADEDED